MYAVYRELHPPTGVEHCLECHFFDLEKSSLVVASTSALKVYNISEVSVWWALLGIPTGLHVYVACGS